MHKKYFIGKEARQAQKLNNMIEKMQQKMERAEALRNEQQQRKIQKAKEAQEKFLIKEIADKKRAIRS